MPVSDDALLYAIECSFAWHADARLIGNVRAGDLRDLLLELRRRRLLDAGTKSVRRAGEPVCSPPGSPCAWCGDPIQADGTCAACGF